MQRKTTGTLFALFLFTATVALAHQPRVGVEGVTYIENPEVSQAFYATLDNGEDETYVISSPTEFNLLVNILVPDLHGIVTESLEFTIENENEEIVFKSDKEHEWEAIYEPFAGDNYLEGPGFEEQSPAGTYTITVSGNESVGKYVIVTGKKEIFPLNEIVNTIVSMPELKMDFFELPFYKVYLNPVGGFLLFLLALMFLVGFLLRKGFKYLKNRAT